ncbi:TPA: DUF4116 domain-containing protein, partial [Clostridioides difficile]
SALQFVKEQTPEICILAVKQNGLALYWVKKQTEEICIKSVMQNGMALQYVVEKTKEICMRALKQNKHAIKYVKEKGDYLKEFGIRYLEAPEDGSEVIAIKEDDQWLFSIGCQKKY